MANARSRRGIIIAGIVCTTAILQIHDGNEDGLFALVLNEDAFAVLGYNIIRFPLINDFHAWVCVNSISVRDGIVFKNAKLANLTELVIFIELFFKVLRASAEFVEVEIFFFTGVKIKNGVSSRRRSIANVETDSEVVFLLKERLLEEVTAAKNLVLKNFFAAMEGGLFKHSSFSQVNEQPFTATITEFLGTNIKEVFQSPIGRNAEKETGDGNRFFQLCERLSRHTEGTTFYLLRRGFKEGLCFGADVLYFLQEVG